MSTEEFLLKSNITSNLSLAVIIATRDRYFLVSELIENLKSQMNVNDKIIICDASNPLQSLLDSPDQRITVIQNNTSGVTQNRNIGLRFLSQLEFDYWCFLDDDLQIPQNYFQELRSNLSSLDRDVGITGSINGYLIPKLPDWLGFYTKRALTRHGYLKMPHSVGVWLPKITNSFFYLSEHFYGYDELELRNFIQFNNLKLKYSENLIVIDNGVSISNAQKITALQIHKTRISQNYKFRYGEKPAKVRKNLYAFRCFLHLAIRGENMSRAWARKMLLNPGMAIAWLNPQDFLPFSETTN